MCKCLNRKFKNAGVPYAFNLTASKESQEVSSDVKINQPNNSAVVARQLLHLVTTQVIICFCGQIT